MRSAREIMWVAPIGGNAASLVETEGFPEVLTTLCGRVCWSDSGAIRDTRRSRRNRGILLVPQAVDIPAKLAANAQLLPRIALMIKLLDLWPQ
jgi:hypothetical protein